eukprot:Hpha_TRINITY_DN13504_c0_g2::TRINITY_DN13504_c0_g2_i1::g.111527::m.111527
MDPVSAASGMLAADKTAKQVFGVIGGDSGGIKKIEGGAVEQERSCSNFMAYVALESAFTNKYCLELPARDSNYSGQGGMMSLGDLRRSFAQRLFGAEQGKELRQKLILDHDRYELSESFPVHQFSNRCRVSVIFTESRTQTLAGVASDAVGTVTGTAVGAVGTVAGTAKSVVTTPLGWFKN